MMQMKIKLDEERLAKKYDVDKVWAMIDDIFAKISAVKEVLPDGAVTYTNHPRHQNTFTDFATMYYKLKSNSIVGQYCKEWFWYDNDEDETQDITTWGEDVLRKEQIDNPLFARGA